MLHAIPIYTCGDVFLMSGLDTTFQVLGNTRNSAAIEVLISGIRNGEPQDRSRYLQAILERPEPRAGDQLLANWNRFKHADIQQIKRNRRWIIRAIESALEQTGTLQKSAMDAATDLELAEVVPSLVSIAESHGSARIRNLATSTIGKIVRPLGIAARQDRDKPLLRRPILARLTESVRRFSMHGNEKLVDAFLCVTTWSDAELRNLVDDNSPQLNLVRRRVETCKNDLFDELIAGFVNRRQAPRWITELIKSGTDAGLRNAILRTVGPDPNTNCRRNLKTMGVPACCRGGIGIIDEIASEHFGALAHVYCAGDDHPIRKIQVAVAAIDQGGDSGVLAGATCLMRCEVPDIETWMRAALIVVGNPEGIENNENARLLDQLLQLLNHGDPNVVRGAQHVLQPLQVDSILHRFDGLRNRNRRNLGKVVLMVDPDAIDRVRDYLRHPVLEHRMAAISAADALAAVDQLADSFEHLSQQDHQEARIRAAEVMSDATGQRTLELLREMVNLPESPVRDAAIEALQHRELATSNSNESRYE